MKTVKPFRHDSRELCRDSNPVPPEYKFSSLPIRRSAPKGNFEICACTFVHNLSSERKKNLVIIF